MALSRNGSRPIVALALLVLAVSCTDTRVRLPVQDDDADDDETPVMCGDASACVGPEETMCHPLGFCVECVNDSDCPPERFCDPREFECERRR